MSHQLFIQWFPLLVRSTTAIALTALIVMLLLRVFRLQSPLMHRIAWAVVLVQGCILTRFALEIPCLDSRFATQLAQSRADESAVTAATSGDAKITGAPDLGSTIFSSGDISHDRKPGGNRELGDPTLFESSKVIPTSDVSILPTTQPRGASGFAVLFAIVCMVWLTGMLASLLTYFLAYLAMLRSLKRAEAVPLPWLTQWNSILRRHQVKVTIPIRAHVHLGPMICLTPRGYQIVVPRDLWDELSMAQRSSILHHELAHFVRGDVWKSFLVRLVAIPHWFNPFVWLAVRKFDECGEWASDRFLLNSDPKAAPEFAQALLKIVQFPHSLGVGFRGAGSSFLTERISRLCRSTRQEESKMKRAVMMSLLGIVLAIGVAEIRLVAPAVGQQKSEASIKSTRLKPEVSRPSKDQAETKTPDADPQESDREIAPEGVTKPSDVQRIEQFAKRLYFDESDTMLARFKTAITSPAGRTVLIERATQIENSLRQQAQRNALPSYFETYFQLENDKLVLKPGQDEYRDSILQQAKQLNSDVDQIQAALDEVRNQLEQTNEAEKLLSRALTQPTTAWVLYSTEVRSKVRPDEATIRDLYKSVFVVDEMNRLLIRPAIRAEIQRQLERGGERQRGLDRIREELSNLSQEISEFDDTHRQLRQLFKDDFFAHVCSFDVIGEDGTADQGVSNLFKYLDRILEDRSDGLRLNSEGQKRMRDLLDRFPARKKAAAQLKQTLQRVASQIPDGYDDLHDQVKKVFPSEFTVVRLTRQGMYGVQSAGDIAKQQFDNRLTKTEDGKLVIEADSDEAVVQFARNLLRGGRAIRRRFQAVDADVSNLKDPQLKEIFESMTGNYLVVRAVQQQFARQRFDGIGRWIGRHFDSTDVGMVLNESSRDEIESLLKQVDEINSELKNDDF